MSHISSNSSSTTVSNNNQNNSTDSSSIELPNNGWYQGKVVGIMPLSTIDQEGSKIIDDGLLYNRVSSFLAFKQIEQRSDEILPLLPQLLHKCKLNISTEYRDSNLSPIHAAAQLLDTGVMTRTTSSSISKTDPPAPFVVLGEYRSAVTQVLNILAAPFELPVMAFASTSADLDGNAYFSRVVPTNAGDALAIAVYLHQHLKVSYVGVLYVRDPWGTAYHTGLVLELHKRNITVVSTSYVNNDMNDVEHSLEHLAHSECRYIVGIIGVSNYDRIHDLAYQYGIMGHPGYTWILTEGSEQITSPSLGLRRDTDHDANLARTFHGLGLVTINFPVYEAYEQAMENFANNKTLQEEFIASQTDSELFEGYTFPPPTLGMYQYLAFDAAIALGIASCTAATAAGGFFTGDDLHRQILHTSFDGITGPISFNRQTGTRNLDNIQFRVRNIVISEERSTHSHYYFASEPAAIVTLGAAAEDGYVDELSPFKYSDNSTVPPSPLPPLQEDLNSITPGARALGLTFGALVILSSIICIIWTLLNRKARVVRSSQPIFLCQICVGTIIMALAAMPLGFQEPMPEHQLNIGCMSVPWLLSVGFVTSFSAIFCKTRRLNKLLKRARHFQRIIINPQDVMAPFAVLMGVNLVLLLAWTFIAPLEWMRMDVSNYDSFGRIRESYGDCRSGQGGYHFLAFALPVLLVNFSSIVIALRQCRKGRGISVEYSESEYLGISMMSLLDAVVLAIPFLFAVSTYPSANYVVRCLFLVIVCFSILLPIFIPKYLAWKNLTHSNLHNNDPSGFDNTSHSHHTHGSVTSSKTVGKVIKSMVKSMSTANFASFLRDDNNVLSSEDDTDNAAAGVMKLHRTSIRN